MASNSSKNVNAEPRLLNGNGTVFQNEVALPSVSDSDGVAATIFHILSEEEGNGTATSTNANADDNNGNGNNDNNNNATTEVPLLKPVGEKRQGLPPLPAEEPPALLGAANAAIQEATTTTAETTAQAERRDPGNSTTPTAEPTYSSPSAPAGRPDYGIKLGICLICF